MVYHIVQCLSVDQADNKPQKRTKNNEVLEILMKHISFHYDYHYYVNLYHKGRKSNCNE